MKLRFDTVLDEGREDEVRELREWEPKPLPAARRSLKATRYEGPIFHLMEDGEVKLQSIKKPERVIDEFGVNGEVVG